MNKFATSLTYFAAQAFSLGAISHNVEFDEHIELVPIPPYDHSYCETVGNNSLTALNAFMDALSSDTKEQLMFELDAKVRHQWSNLPARMDSRPGISLEVLSDEQRALLFRFLSVSLDQDGYQSVAETMAAEAFLANDSKAERFRWAPENYWLSIYGEPSNTTEWAWAFGGHHLAINVSMNMGTATSMSPYFVGAEPAQFILNGIEYDAIGDMHSAGYAIYQSLDQAQKQAAGLSRAPNEVLVGADKDGVVPPIEGLNVGEMTEEQKLLVLNAAYKWVSHQVEETSIPSMEEIASELEDTYFVWFGEIGVTSSAYFRIQGPSVIIELLGGMRTVGNSAQGLGHYHTVYRDPTNDYGQAN